MIRQGEKNGPRLVSVVFRVPKSKLDAVKALSNATRVRQSEYLREAISDVLVKHGMGPSAPAEPSGMVHQPLPCARCRVKPPTLGRRHCLACEETILREYHERESTESAI